MLSVTGVVPPHLRHPERPVCGDDRPLTYGSPRRTTIQAVVDDAFVELVKGYTGRQTMAQASMIRRRAAAKARGTGKLRS